MAEILPLDLIAATALLAARLPARPLGAAASQALLRLKRPRA
jgi:hypothetical protein